MCCSSSKNRFSYLILCCSLLWIASNRIEAFSITPTVGFASSWKHKNHNVAAPERVVARFAAKPADSQPFDALEQATESVIKEAFHSSERFDWIVYVDQSKASLERGGVATLDAFMGLVPSRKISVKAAMFPKPPKGKGPYIRCVPVRQSGEYTAFEVSNVNSVEKVYRVLTKHMGLSGIQIQTCDCLKLKYKGTGYLEAKKPPLAIEAYNRALELEVSSQDGVILFMRAAAHAALAATHRDVLQGMLNELKVMVPSKPTMRGMYALAAHEAGLTNAILRKIRHDTRRQEKQLSRIQFRHGLFQHAMLMALEDAQKATVLLPNYAPAWERAGSILSDLWRLDESLECYQKAQQLDSSLKLKPAFDRIRKRQKLVTDAKSYEWAEEPLRLALDAKG
ncbi:hypothetical protein ACA910_007778 [Epithemia clementina (nom. ined.)]